MFETINNLHDRVNVLTNIMMFQFELKSLFDDKHINKRQYEIMNKISTEGALTKRDLFSKSWYLQLYTRLTDKTRQRDLRKLKDLKLLSTDKKGRFVLYGMSWYKS